MAITNLRFADDIDGLAGVEQELANLVECLDKTSAAYGMKISAEKTKLMTNNTHGSQSQWTGATSFKFLGSIITDEGSKPDILAVITQATAALTRLKPICNDSKINLSSNISRKAPLSYPSFCTLVKHGPSSSQHIYSGGYKLFK